MSLTFKIITVFREYVGVSSGLKTLDSPKTWIIWLRFFGLQKAAEKLANKNH